MCKSKFPYRGFIIVLIDKESGDKITSYTDVVSWKDAICSASKLLSLKKYENCVLYQIHRCISHEKNL